MPTPTEILTDAVREALTEGAATSPIYDADTLTDNVVMKINAAALEVAGVGDSADKETRIAELETRVAELEAQVASKSADTAAGTQ